MRRMFTSVSSSMLADASTRISTCWPPTRMPVRYSRSPVPLKPRTAAPPPGFLVWSSSRFAPSSSEAMSAFSFSSRARRASVSASDSASSCFAASSSASTRSESPWVVTLDLSSTSREFLISARFLRSSRSCCSTSSASERRSSVTFLTCEFPCAVISMKISTTEPKPQQIASRNDMLKTSNLRRGTLQPSRRTSSSSMPGVPTRTRSPAARCTRRSTRPPLTNVP